MTTVSLTGLNTLISELDRRGYEVYGPTVNNGAIAHERIDSVDDLPRGVGDEQSGGHYRLTDRGDQARFGYAVGPRSWKEILHPPRAPVWSITRSGGDGTPVELSVKMADPPVTKRAFLGVRPCELAAIGKQDRVLAHGPHPDPVYQANRADTIIIAVNCGAPADTCFCTSMGTGPRAGLGFDLALTEIDIGPSATAPAATAPPGTNGNRGPSPRYVVDVGSDIGADLLDSLDPDDFASAPDDAMRAEAVLQAAADTMVRRLETEGVKELLYANLESPQWEEIATRCLSCANCTLACPTCFCTNLEDVTDLGGDITDRWRVWDSCFSLEFSHLGPGPHRASTASRYRQWLVHKLGSWHDQFGESGCVGCGRCITWCPVGIDLTAEMALMRSGAS